MEKSEIEREMSRAISGIADEHCLTIEETVQMLSNVLERFRKRAHGLEPCPNCGHYGCDLNCPGV